MKFKSLSVVAPAGSKIASQKKVIEVRQWQPDILPLKDLLIVENESRLSHDGISVDPNGHPVAFVDVVEVNEWKKEDIDAACASYWEEGWFAWKLENIRRVKSDSLVPAKLRIYEVELNEFKIIEDMRKIEVVDYDTFWPKQFEVERDSLGRALANVATVIHHIGSTAVPGLAAKPIIDILIEVTSLTALDMLNEKMKALGYIPKGEFGIAGRRYFQKSRQYRTHQVHAFACGDFNLTRHLAFRDYLRINTDIAQEYGELKKCVAESCGNDINRYCDGKDAFVKRVEAKAIEQLPPETG